MKIEDPSNINNLPNLESLDFKTPKLATVNEPRIDEIETLQVVFHGTSLELNIKNIGSFDDGLICMDIYIEVLTEMKKNIADIHVNVVKNKDGTCRANTNVKNKNREMKRLGRTLWELSLQLIQKLADKWNIPIMHEVSKAPDPRWRNNKWDELFTPLLVKHEYSSKGEDSWEKIYLPQK